MKLERVNLLRYSLLSTVLGVGICVFGSALGISRVTKSSNQFEAAQKALARLVMSGDENRDDVGELRDIIQQIYQLEDENGITELLDRLAQLRVEACEKQQSDSEIRSYDAEIQKLIAEINEKTAGERQKIDELARRSRESDSDEAREQMAELQQAAAEKTRKLAREISVLNKKIRGRMSQEMDKGKRLSEEIRRKYEPLRDELDELDDSIAGVVKRVNRRLKSKSEELLQARKALQEAGKEMRKQDPCFIVRQGSKPAHWVQHFL